jgi:magnesium chelatase family protein
MPAARVHAVALTGAEGHPVQITASLGAGPPGLLLTGLPDTAVREIRDRIRAAVINSGEAWPQATVTVQLSPAALPKRGAGFDLAIAVAILAAAGAVAAAAAGRAVLLGELGLDGQLRPVRGILPAVAAARAAEHGLVIVPAVNAAEAALVSYITVLGAPSLAAVLAWFRGRSPAPGREALQVCNHPAGGGRTAGPQPSPDLAGLADQPEGRRAAELCAAGGHHLLLTGPPGAGAVMLAERIPGLLPPLDEAGALEVTALHSLAGTLPPAGPLITAPPLASPHHTVSRAAMIGGGSQLTHPGAASLAHRGVLFLDQAPEFARDVLDALRQPLETGQAIIARAGCTVRFPARFILVLAARLCPCGRAAGGGECRCTPLARRRYHARLSGPVLDRIDLTIGLRPPGQARPASDRGAAEPGSAVAGRVAAARQRAARRLAGTPWRLNAEIPASQLPRRFPPAPGALRPLQRAVELGEISHRGAGRALALAWTLADLAGKPQPEAAETIAALALRLDRPA